MELNEEDDPTSWRSLGKTVRGSCKGRGPGQRERVVGPGMRRAQSRSEVQGAMGSDP